jgi:hypothetical protein
MKSDTVNRDPQTAGAAEEKKMNTRIVNKYGAILITCVCHYEWQAAHIYGLMMETATPTADECPICREECQHYEHPAKVRAALLDPRCTHTRFRSFGSSGYVTVYHRDATSPTGVFAAVGASAELFDKIYNELRTAGLLSSSKSPLSPTEGLGGR